MPDPLPLNAGAAEPAPAPLPPQAVPAMTTVQAVPANPTLREKLELAIGQLVVLRATTVVGAVTVTGASELNLATGLTLEPAGQQVASTSFNMLLGDGSVIVAPIYVTDPAYKALHDQTVKHAGEIRTQSVQLLRDMWDKFQPLLENRLDRKPGA